MFVPTPGPVSNHALPGNLCRWEVPRVPSGKWLELARRNLRDIEGIRSSSEVNWLIDWFGGERLPAIDLAHVDLA